MRWLMNWLVDGSMLRPKLNDACGPAVRFGSWLYFDCLKVSLSKASVNCDCLMVRLRSKAISTAFCNDITSCASALKLNDKNTTTQITVALKDGINFSFIRFFYTMVSN